MRRKAGGSQAFPVGSHSPDSFTKMSSIPGTGRDLERVSPVLVQIGLMTLSFLDMWQRELKASWSGRTKFLVCGVLGSSPSSATGWRGTWSSLTLLGPLLLVCGMSCSPLRCPHSTHILWLQTSAAHSGILEALESTVLTAPRELQEKVPGFCREVVLENT